MGIIRLIEIGTRSGRLFNTAYIYTVLNSREPEIVMPSNTEVAPGMFLHELRYVSGILETRLADANGDPLFVENTPQEVIVAAETALDNANITLRFNLPAHYGTINVTAPLIPWDLNGGLFRSRAAENTAGTNINYALEQLETDGWVAVSGAHVQKEIN